MTYNPNIPQATDNLSNSQGQFLINFGQLNTQFGIDHVPFNNSGINGTGYHNKSTYPAQASNPTAVATSGIVYTRKNPDTNILRTDPYYVNDPGTLGNSLIAPFLPIKAFGVINVQTNSLAAGVTPFNIASVTGTSANYTITFTNPITSASGSVAYCVLTGVDSSTIATPSVVYFNTTGASFHMATNAQFLISFAVLQF